MSEDRTRKRRWPLYVLFAGLVAAVLCFTLVDICPLFEAILPTVKINKTTFTSFIRSLGPWGPVGSIGLMTLHSFVPFPAEFLSIANGMVFGPFWGVVVTWIGAMSGAYASFGLTRRYGRPFVAGKINAPQLEKLDRWLEHQGAIPLLLSRLMPIISFNLINYGAGLTPISWWTFTWTTGIGILPMTILMVLMGNNFRVLPWWIWLLLLLAIMGAAYLASLHGRNIRQE